MVRPPGDLAVELEQHLVVVVEEHQRRDHSNLKYGRNAICSWLIMWPFRLTYSPPDFSHNLSK
jgi:hypothetical protein